VATGTWNAETIAVAHGGTGATDATAARTNLGLGNLSNQNSNNVLITGGLITGVVVEGYSATSKSGAVFITDVVPQDTSENVGNKFFSSDNIVLKSCSSTTNLVRINVLAITGHTNYTPNIFINGSLVANLSPRTDAPLFSGFVDIDLSNSNVVIANHEDGAQSSITIERDEPPEIQSANFINGYPGSQTELKENDKFDVVVNSDIDVTGVEIENYGAFKYSLFSNLSANTSHTISGNIANRGNTTQSLGAKLRVKKITGAWSDYYLTESEGSLDGSNLVKLNNTKPTISISGISYPVNQNAIKFSENATITNSVNNFDSILYLSPNNEININSATVYETSKSVSYSSGTYNISNNNFRIIAIKDSNNATSMSNTVVNIANVAPTISLSITNNPTRLRSGGNDNTSAQNYTLNLISNQQLIISPNLSAPSGTFVSNFSGSGQNWSRTLRIHDNDQKGSYNFGSLSALSLSRIEQNAINNGATYILGGFVSRNINLQAFSSQTKFNVPVSDYNKVVLNWNFNSSVIQRQPIDTPQSPPLAGSWCLLSPINESPVNIRILDDSYNSSSQSSIITIEETQ
jgi:hypothetical protein